MSITPSTLRSYAILRCVLVVITGLVIGAGANVSSISPTKTRDGSSNIAHTAPSLTRPLGAYGRLPITFEPNVGQASPEAKFIARGHGYTLALTPDGAVFSMLTSECAAKDLPPLPNDISCRADRALIRMSVIGANGTARTVGLERAPGVVNYFVGNDPARWRTRISTYSRVRYEDVYAGIDLEYYGDHGELEYDFIARPGADPNTIRLQFDGADNIHVDSTGDLVLAKAGRQFRQRKPYAYQNIAGNKREVSATYRLIGSDRVAFDLGPYDSTRTLVIDPVLVYSTYLGGSNTDQNFAIAVDAAGAAYTTGITNSTDFPTSPAAFDSTFNGGSFDVVVTKVDPSGSFLIYSTYLGADGFDVGYSIAVDPFGSAHIAGWTNSARFPTTVGAFDGTYNGTADAFITKLDPSGSALAYSTFLGGSGEDVASGGIALDFAGNAYVTGRTRFATNFPTTPGAYDTTYNGALDAFITKLNASGSALVYSTYLGGPRDDETLFHSMAVNVLGEAYIAGYTYSSDFPTTLNAYDQTHNGVSDAFVAKLDARGSALVYSTFFGGSGEDSARSLAIDTLGSVYLAGTTRSSDLPTTPGSFDSTFNGVVDAFVAKFDPIGSSVIYSTFLGGSGEEQYPSLAVDAMSNAYISGQTQSPDFPTTAGAHDSTLNGVSDAFVTKLNAAQSAPLLYSTFLGGSEFDTAFQITLDSTTAAYVTGDTGSTDFPTTPAAYDTTFNGVVDGFITKLVLVGLPATLTIDPAAATNSVDTEHCVTATVRDAGGNPVPDVTVRFEVTGSVTTSGSATTNDDGEARFCYHGPPLPGQDAITAFADTDEDGQSDPGEPSGAASKTWVFPLTTPLCEVIITNGGRITAANGDRATFGGNATASATGETRGQEEYIDHGPAQPLNVHSISVDAIVCRSATDADIFGQATVGSAGSFAYRIRVQDLGESGRGQDTYGIVLANGYYSGEQLLEAGNVQIRREE